MQFLQPLSKESFIDRIVSPSSQKMSTHKSIGSAEGISARDYHKPVLAETPRDACGFFDGLEEERAGATERRWQTRAGRDETSNEKKKTRRTERNELWQRPWDP